MESMTFTTSGAPRLIIERVGGDLRLVGRPGRQLEVQAPAKGELTVRQDGDQIRLSCRSGCLVFMPEAARVEIDQVGGDLRVTRHAGELGAKSIGGDVRLLTARSVMLEQVGGSVTAEQVDGDMAMQIVGGDVTVDRILGELRLGRAGGDLRLQAGSGGIAAVTGGDARLNLSPAAGSHCRVEAAGDITCRLPADVSAFLAVRAGGDLRLPAGEWQMKDGQQSELKMASGEARVELQAGGDLRVRIGTGETAQAAGMGDLGERIAAQVESHLSELENRLGEMDIGLPGMDPERIGERVRRAVDRALRAANRHEGWGSGGIAAEAGAASDSQAAEPVGDDERLSVLRMLEEGKIGLEQAEALLKALENET
jgi:hypothetical protein